MNEFLELLNRCPFPYPLTTIGGIILLFAFIGYLFRDKPEKPLTDLAAIKIKSIFDSVKLCNWRKEDDGRFVSDDNKLWFFVDFEPGYDYIVKFEHRNTINSEKDLDTIEKYLIKLYYDIRKYQRNVKRDAFLNS